MRKIFLVIGLAILIFSASMISAARMPVVSGDDNAWGTVLNAYLNISLNDSGQIKNDTISSLHLIDGTIVDEDVSDITNLTLGQKITFALGEIIDNLVDGVINIAGSLRVEGEGNFSGIFYYNNQTPITALNITNLALSINTTNNIELLYNSTSLLFSQLVNSTLNTQSILAGTNISQYALNQTLQTFNMANSSWDNRYLVAMLSENISSLNTTANIQNLLNETGIYNQGSSGIPLWINDSFQIYNNLSYPTYVNLSGVLYVNGTSGNVGIGTNPYEDTDSSGVLNIARESTKILDLRMDNDLAGNTGAGAFVSLHVRETGGDPAVGFGIDDDASGSSIGHSWHLGIDNSNDDVFTINQGGIGDNSMITIRRQGYLGLIGANNPNMSLEIKGNNTSPDTSGIAEGDGILRLQPDGTTIVLDMGADGSIPVSWIQSRRNSDFSTNYNLALQPNGGNVGIGTTEPTHTLEVNGLTTGTLIKGSTYPFIAQLTAEADTSAYVASFQRANVGTGVMYLNFAAGAGRMYMTQSPNGDTSFTNYDGATYRTTLALDASTGGVNFGGEITGITKLSFDYGTDFSIDTNANGLVFDGGDGSPDFLIYDNYIYSDALLLGYTGGALITTYDTDEDLTINPDGTGTVLMVGLAAGTETANICGISATGELLMETDDVCDVSTALYKEDMQPISYGLNEIMLLNPISFKYIEELKKDDNTRLGFTAEEMFDIIPEVVTFDRTEDIGVNFKNSGIDYAKLTAVLTKAIQEQQTIIKNQNETISNMQTQLIALKKALCSLHPELELCKK